MPEFVAPKPETQNVVLVGEMTLRQAEKLIIGCEGCSPCDAEIRFNSVLQGLTGNDPAMSKHIFVEAMANCPNCQRQIHEKTLVELK